MLSNEPIKNMADYCVQYDICFTDEGADAEFIKGRKVDGENLVHLIWKLIPAVYRQMAGRNEKIWNIMICYLKEGLSERVCSDAFWIGYLNSTVSEPVSSDKRINVSSVIADEDHIDLIFTSTKGLTGKDYLEGISALVWKTYTSLLEEDRTMALWLKQSLKDLVQKESFWENETVTDEETDSLRSEFYNTNQRFS